MKKLILFLIFTLSCSVCFAQDAAQPDLPKGVKNLSRFESIAILDNGRVKPLDTYARSVLLQFSGRAAFKKESASRWLARHVFAPYSTQKDEIFLINHPDVLKALGIDEKSKERRFSYEKLEPALDQLKALAHKIDEIDPKERDAVESELIRLYNNVSLYAKLSLSSSFIFPHADFTVNSVKLRKDMNLPTRQGSQYSFFDVAWNASILDQEMQPLEDLPLANWNERQKESASLITHLMDWMSAYRDIPLSVIPPFDPQDQIWKSPWDAMHQALSDSAGRKELQAWRDMTDAFWKGEQTSFNLAVQTFRSSVDSRIIRHHSGWQTKFKLELFFNHLNPFLWAKIFYLLTFFLFLAGLVWSKPWIYRLAWAVVIAALSLQTLGLILRVVILERPPVSNLYETFVFVSFVSVITGIIIERFHKQWLGLVIASISGVVFLWIAAKFSIEGDTLQMLVAVLNSNFWLSTHVLSITIGYSGMCVAGIVGHMYLIQNIVRPKDKELLKRTHNILLGTLGFGLTMTFLGTNLGGIWADQSWGRFWGWDPKENGALMIVIWGAILFHARMAGIIGPPGMAVGSVLGIIIVMWAWFGVNLLSVGLHSYGFTSGLAVNLMVYMILQLLFLIVSVAWIRKNSSAVEKTR